MLSASPEITLVGAPMSVFIKTLRPLLPEKLASAVYRTAAAVYIGVEWPPEAGLSSRRALPHRRRRLWRDDGRRPNAFAACQSCPIVPPGRRSARR